MTRLDEREIRHDLTSRECATLVGAVIGGLLRMAPADDVRTAIRWYAECDEVWQAFLVTDAVTDETLREAAEFIEASKNGSNGS